MPMLPALRRVLIALAGLAFACASHAQADWPGRAVRLVVPFPAGGGIDIAARQIADRLRERWSQPVIVENRPGANSLLAVQAVLGAPRDGYTLLVTNPITFYLPDVSPTTKIRPLDEFVAVAQLSSEQLALVVTADAPAGGLAAALDAARADPKAWAFGSYGYGSLAHLLQVQLNASRGTTLAHVPYKGTAPLVQGMMSGEVRLGVSNFATVRPFLESGRLRALAVTGPVRSPFLREVPTLAEAGVPGFEMTQWAGLFAPAGTPAAVVERLGRDLAEVLKSDVLARRLAELYLLPGEAFGADFDRIVRRDAGRLGEMSRAASIRLGD